MSAQLSLSGVKRTRYAQAEFFSDPDPVCENSYSGEMWKIQFSNTGASFSHVHLILNRAFSTPSPVLLGAGELENRENQRKHRTSR